MDRTKRVFALGGCALLGLSAYVQAEVPAGQADTGAQIAALQARVAELEGQKSQSWMNERRAEEVKSLIREVLSDADTRASLQESAMTAGHNGKNFFLASEDGGFLLKVSGQMQLRYVANFRDEGNITIDDEVIEVQPGDKEELGFEARRAKIEFAGHIADPKLTYALTLAVDSDDNSVYADKIVIGYELAEGFTLWGGEDKAPVLREEIMSSKRMLAVDRSYLNEVFTIDRVQGVGVAWESDMLKVNAMINDGYKSGDGETSVNPRTQAGGSQYMVDEDGEIIVDDDDIPIDFSQGSSKSFNGDASDFALSARVDVKLAGEWSQWDDFSSWDGDDMAIFLGGAFHWEVGETGDTRLNNDFLLWTLDGQVKVAGLGVYGAIVGEHTSLDDASAGEERDSYGLLLQAGYMIIPDKLEPFVRFEYISFDEEIAATNNDELMLLTFGANYYLKKHNAKFTLDMVWAFDPVPYSSTGLGLLADAGDAEDQIAIRAQFQLLF